MQDCRTNADGFYRNKSVRAHYVLESPVLRRVFALVSVLMLKSMGIWRRPIG